MKHLLTLSLNSKDLEVHLAQAIFSLLIFQRRSVPVQLLNPGSRFVSHYADVPLDKTISGIPKPGSCLDGAILFSI